MHYIFFIFSLLTCLHVITNENYILEIPTEVITNFDNSSYSGISDNNDILIHCHKNGENKYFILGNDKSLINLNEDKNNSQLKIDNEIAMCSNANKYWFKKISKSGIAIGGRFNESGYGIKVAAI